MNSRFFVVGLSYKRSDINHRSRFAFNHEDTIHSYTCSDAHFFILSTCNRTEVYGFTPDAAVLANILQHKAGCTAEELAALTYTKEDDEAILHFFRVAAGLDSQIPGDYEITAQVKTSFLLAKEHSRTNGFMEKIFNYALQASKDIKNTTSFSDGTISVAYSVASQIVKANLKSVTVFGAGETGELIIKYLRKLQPAVVINLVNRDVTRLNAIASAYNVFAFPMPLLREAISESDALVVTTNANRPLVETRHLERTELKMVFDLSVPRNIDDAVYDLMTVYDVDTVSRQINATIENRLLEVPRVEAIIAKHMEEFKNWSRRRQLYSIYP